MLWPRPSLAHSAERVVTLGVWADGGDVVKRTYAVRPTAASQQKHAISMFCVDSIRERLADGRLPPRACDGEFVNLAYKSRIAVLAMWLCSSAVMKPREEAR